MAGSEWGFEWGEAYWGDAELDVRSRLLKFVRSPNLVALTQTFADRTEALLDAAASVAAAFDLNTAVGAQLDTLGAILQLPRYGYDDDRYRTLLKIQARLILSSTTTTPVILEIVALFTGANPVSYADSYPMGFAVGAVVPAVDVALLLELLGKAKAAAYNVELLVSYTAGDMITDYTPEDPIAGATGITDYTPALPVAGATPTGYSFEV